MKNKSLLVFLVVVLLGVLPLEAQRSTVRSNRSRSTVRRQQLLPRRVVPSRTRVVVRRPIVRSYRSYSYGRNYYGFGYGLSYESYGRYGYAPLPRPSGLKFNLELVSEKDKKMVEQGKVFIDGLDKGIVGRYDGRWNKALVYPPGVYEIEVRLKDGRTFNTRIEILSEQIAPVYPEFD